VLDLEVVIFVAKLPCRQATGDRLFVVLLITSRSRHRVTTWHLEWPLWW